MSLFEWLGPLLISILTGTLIGYLNETNEHIGGGRTYAIICCGSTLVALTSRTFFVALGLPWVSDPGRLSAQIIPAMIYLTSGLVLISGTKSMGASSVTNLWVTALIGMMIGSGFGTTAILISMFMITCGIFVGRFEIFLARRRGEEFPIQYSSRYRPRKKSQKENEVN